MTISSLITDSTTNNNLFELELFLEFGQCLIGMLTKWLLWYVGGGRLTIYKILSKLIMGSHYLRKQTGVFKIKSTVLEQGRKWNHSLKYKLYIRTKYNKPTTFQKSKHISLTHNPSLTHVLKTNR